MLYDNENTYGTLEGVAAYVGVYSNDGVFDETTTPTDDQIHIWLDQVSNLFHLALANVGFEVPVTQIDAESAIAGMVEQIVSDLVHAANSKGRFFGKSFQDKGNYLMGQIQADIRDWVDANTAGFENLGVPRTHGTIGKIGSKGKDRSGEELFPFTQRKAFGNKTPNWDS